MILAIETSTPVCSVALQNSAGRILEKRIEGRGVHSDHTFLFAEELMERADTSISGLEAVLFSNGPGSYTGLRIGAAAIKGLLFGREIPLFTFPTLLAFAAGAMGRQSSGTIHAVIDARRNHLYYQSVGIRQLDISEPEVWMRFRTWFSKTILLWDRLSDRDPEKVTYIYRSNSCIRGGANTSGRSEF
jgi:tRNA threonylcarbamoyladenosine biosynthesis protein TsaB